jgi:DNA-binding transcriptional regulator YiaG
MKPDEIKEIRERLEISREDMADVLCLGYRSLMHIEWSTRNPSKLTIRLLRYIESLSKAKALAFIEELKRHEPK